ncbi:MAG: hypothetical protein J7L64_02485 [Acidobacteria bacterium]|nr:hypothetical protein [Acidobacteriota bacterium]
MNENVRIPVQIKRVKDPSGREIMKATVPMNLIFEKDFNPDWFERELAKFEERYFNLVTHLKSLLKKIRIKKPKDGRVLLYWEFGNEIIEFKEQSKNNALFLENLTKSLARDVEVSDKIITRCTRFRSLYPDITQIDPNRSFDSYVAEFEGGYISARRQGRREGG